jgi:hypothetical protein
MSISKFVVNGSTVYFEGGRPLDGGVAHSNITGLLTALVAVTAPTYNVVTIANSATVNLNTGFNIFETTGNNSLTGATINVPTANDSALLVISTTNAVTTVSGTLANANNVLPPVTSLASGSPVHLSYNAATKKWFHV